MFVLCQGGICRFTAILDSMERTKGCLEPIPLNACRHSAVII